MKHETNIDDYNIAAIERKMQNMSKQAANNLGETQKKTTEKNTAKKKGK